MSIHMKGENNPNFGKKLSKEHRNKISKNHINVKGENNPMFGIHRFGKDAPNWKQDHDR